MTTADEAKQLDSVTDMVKEAELDESKAQQAMSALSSSAKEEDSKAAALASVAVSKGDVALIVSELEVTDEVAERALREVAAGAEEGKMLEEALRKLVTSS
jgi:NACalpha-BTF3-like transcription factor